jgi:radical SAM superfamily enzyme YgiQ (UPF0313 family)
MKVQFVFAPARTKTNFSSVLESASPPLGILYLAGYLRQAAPDVELAAVDGFMLGMEESLAQIRAFSPDVLCVSFYTGSAGGAYALINQVKREHPAVMVIAGGPHASALPEDVFAQSQTDVVVRGEGEQSLAALVIALRSGHKLDPELLSGIPNLAFMDRQGCLQANPVTALIRDLDSIPFPAWDLLPIQRYRGYFLSRQTPELPVLFSRGCTHDCTFCSNDHWHLVKPTMRFRSPKNIGDEIEELARAYGVREVLNLADELNNHPVLAPEICAEIKKRKLGITWKTQLRPDHVPEELARAMAESGCWLVAIGIETGNPETLKGVRKNFTHEQIEQSCRNLKKYGIKIQGYFMLYNAWEADGEFHYEDTRMSRQTIAYAERLFAQGLLDFMGWSVTIPYPGSELYQVAFRHGRIPPGREGRWDQWSLNGLSVMSLPGEDSLEQARVLRKAQKLGAKALLLRSGIRLKDLPLMMRTAAHTMGTGIRSLRKPA